MGLVIRLKYYLQKPDPLFPKALNYYAEHCMPVTDVKEMRMVLKAAKDYINSKFDLDMSDVPSATVLLDKQKDLPDEISPDDEISILEGDPCYTAQPERLKSLDELSVEPATCPIFGIRP
jgi:hypothetical protein